MSGLEILTGGYIGRHRIGNGKANAARYFQPALYTIEWWSDEGRQWVTYTKSRNYLGRYIGEAA